MNVTVYLFGEFHSGYSQYPNDYTSKIFRTCYSHAKSTTQVAIHRDGDLMYYGYIRKLENGRYIGLCAVLNGLYLTRVDVLFSLYENVVSNLIKQGRLIYFNEQGEVVSSIEKLYVNKEEIDLITESLRAGFSRLGDCVANLPTVDYGRSRDSIEEFSIDDSIDEIIPSTYKNGYTFIYKSKNFNTAQLNSYKGVLARISNENTNLKKEKNELQKKLQIVQRQKKQITKVVFLILVVIVCGFGIYFLNQNLNTTQGQLDKANGTIQVKNTEIKKREVKISSLQNSFDALQQSFNNEKTARIQAEEELEKVNRLLPFVPINCTVNSTDFSFDYYASEEKKLTVTLITINVSNFEIISGDYTLTCYKGGGSYMLEFDNKLSSSDDYYVVLMCNGKIIAGKKW